MKGCAARVCLRCYHRRMSEAQGFRLKTYARYCLSLRLCALGLLLFSSACPRAPPAPSAASIKPPTITWEEKLGWILRLEDQRLIRDPNPPARGTSCPHPRGPR